MTYNPTEAVNAIREGVAAAEGVRMPKHVRTTLEEVAALDEWLADGGRNPAQWGHRRVGRTPLETDGWINPELTKHQHGLRYGYNQKCRCLPCRAANRHEDPAVILEMKKERGWA